MLIPLSIDDDTSAITFNAGPLIEVHATRAGRPWPPSRLLEDIRAADIVTVCSPWFSNWSIAYALTASHALSKTLITSSTTRESAAERYLQQSKVHCYRVNPRTEDDPLPIVHMKLVVADPITWIGSSNWTEQSERNDEILFRVDDVETSIRCAHELHLLQSREWYSSEGLLNIAAQTERSIAENRDYERRRMMTRQLMHQSHVLLDELYSGDLCVRCYGVQEKLVRSSLDRLFAIDRAESRARRERSHASE